MSSPSNNASPFRHYVESTNEPKTLHGVQITVESWKSAGVFGAPDPNILPPAFVDEATG